MLKKQHIVSYTWFWFWHGSFKKIDCPKVTNVWSLFLNRNLDERERYLMFVLCCKRANTKTKPMLHHESFSGKPWYRLIPLNHLEFEHPRDSNPQVSFYPGQCQCSLSPRMCHGEEKGNLRKAGQRHTYYIYKAPSANNEAHTSVLEEYVFQSLQTSIVALDSNFLMTS